MQWESNGGYNMTNIIHLDFETRSEVDIWKVGAWNYSVHPSTEILCMAISINNEQVDLYTQEHALIGNLPKDAIFTAHYSMFENYIWHNILVKKFGWPKIPLKQWRCTAAQAAAHALPRSLKNAAIALNLKQQKDEDGRRIMLKMCKPRAITKNNSAKWHEDPEDFQKLYDYCINDVEVERAIDNTLPRLSDSEQQVWLHDQMVNTRGIQVDTEAVDAALYLIEQFTEECNNEVEQLTDGYLNKVSQRTRVLNWMQTQGVHLAGYTKDDVANALKENMPPQVKRVLEIRQQTGKTSVKKYEALKNATCSDSRVRDLFVYHGASTGRWAGKIVQPHNLPRGNVKDPDFAIEIMKMRDLETFKFFYPDVMGAFSSCVRGMFVAAPGKELLVVDFASIEARVLAWVAGEEQALKYFREKEDSYVKMAELIFETTNIDSSKRFVGKQAVLGCGYGMGWKKFMGTCESLGQKVSEALAKKAVHTFRNRNKNIVDLWYKTEQAAIDAVRYRKETFTYNKTNAVQIKWHIKKDFLYCTLPSQ